jgi:hypothetical protein
MKFFGTAEYTQILIPNHPFQGLCENCRETQFFRLLTKYRFTHLAYTLRWNYEEENFRICSKCDHAYRLSNREMKALAPLYVPLPSTYRRRVVFAVIWVPVIVYVIYWNVRKYGGF